VGFTGRRVGEEADGNPQGIRGRENEIIEGLSTKHNMCVNGKKIHPKMQIWGKKNLKGGVDRNMEKIKGVLTW